LVLYYIVVSTSHEAVQMNNTNMEHAAEGELETFLLSCISPVGIVLHGAVARWQPLACRGHSVEWPNSVFVLSEGEDMRRKASGARQQRHQHSSNTCRRVRRRRRRRLRRRV
jgi:hypothetical protein